MKSSSTIIAFLACSYLAMAVSQATESPVTPDSPKYPAVKDAIDKIKAINPEKGKQLSDKLAEGKIHVSDDLGERAGVVSGDTIILNDVLFRNDNTARNPWLLAAVLLHEGSHLDGDSLSDWVAKVLFGLCLKSELEHEILADCVAIMFLDKAILDQWQQYNSLVGAIALTWISLGIALEMPPYDKLHIQALVDQLDQQLDDLADLLENIEEKTEALIKLSGHMSGSNVIKKSSDRYGEVQEMCDEIGQIADKTFTTIEAARSDLGVCWEFSEVVEEWLLLDPPPPPLPPSVVWPQFPVAPMLEWETSFMSFYNETIRRNAAWVAIPRGRKVSELLAHVPPKDRGEAMRDLNEFVRHPIYE